MPNRPVTIRRWEVVAAFVAMVLVAVGSAIYTDHRVDDAYNRITRNTQRIAGAEADAHVARAIAKAGKANDRKLCGEIAAIKAQIVSSLISNRGQAKRYVGKIPGYTAKDAAIAERRLDDAVRRFGPRPCPAPNLKKVKR